MRQILGLDLGNQNFRLVFGTQTKEGKPKILSAIERPSAGMTKGAVVDFEEFSKALKNLFEEFEAMTGKSVKNVFISVSGPHCVVKRGKGTAPVSRADGEISELDISQVIHRSQDINLSANKTILDVVPREYTVDDLSGIKDPIGMHGIKLEVDSLIIEGFLPNIKTIEKAFDEIGIEIEEKVFTPLASARSSVSKKSEEAGSILIDIGAVSTGISVFEDGKLLTTGSFPVGANHITHDIAICLKTSLDVAERIKLSFGSALPSEVSRKDTIDLSKISRDLEGEISRRYLAEIIEARLEEIFDFISEELKKIGRQAKLPAGAIIVGGGAKMPQMVEFAKNHLRLPAKIGRPINLDLEETTEEIIDQIDDPSFSAATGLFLWGLADTRTGKIRISFPLLSKVKKIFKIFLP